MKTRKTTVRVSVEEVKQLSILDKCAEEFIKLGWSYPNTRPEPWAKIIMLTKPPHSDVIPGYFDSVDDSFHESESTDHCRVRDVLVWKYPEKWRTEREKNKAEIVYQKEICAAEAKCESELAGIRAYVAELETANEELKATCEELERQEGW